MKRFVWTMTAALAVGLGLGVGGLIIQSHVTGQEFRRDKESAVNTSKTISGKVAKVLKNDHGDIDALALENGEIVHFPPHVGDAVTQLVKVGDRIEVQGREETTPKGEEVFEAERIERRGKFVEIDHPQPPRGRRPGPGVGPGAEKPMNVTGTIEEFQTNRHGDVDGVLLSDGTEVKVPPHQGTELQKLAIVGAEVRVEGRRHETPRGDIHLHADRIVATKSGRTFERDDPRDRRPAPPHEQILQELREIRRLIESQQKS